MKKIRLDPNEVNTFSHPYSSRKYCRIKKTYTIDAKAKIC
jgi:hypothetical protein